MFPFKRLKYSFIGAVPCFGLFTAFESQLLKEYHTQLLRRLDIELGTCQRIDLFR